MEKKDNYLIEVEVAMNSLNGIHSASPEAFFYTRLQARLKKEQTGLWNVIMFFITKPTSAFVGLSLIVLVNVMVFVYQKNTLNNIEDEQIEQQNYSDIYTSNASINFYYEENVDFNK